MGDLAYGVTTHPAEGLTTNDAGGVKLIGQIRQITNPTSSTPTVICETILRGGSPGLSTFILFITDNKPNLIPLLV